MDNPNIINQKKLTKKEVSEILKSDSLFKMREDFAEVFCERDYNGNLFEQDLVYELKDGNFLVIRDPKIMREGGKGDIWKKLFMLRYVGWSLRFKEDYENNRGSSIDHWKYYTKFKNNLPSKIQELLSKLKSDLKLNSKEIDFSYKSLDKISDLIEEIEVKERFDNFYDSLVAYVGEVIRKRIEGEWKIDKNFKNPYIGTSNSNVVLNPINIVWEQTSGLQKVNLKKATINEIKNVSQIYKIVK